MLRRLQFDLSYLFKPPWDSGVSPPELLVYLDTHAPGRALDLGCGSGTNVLTLAQRGWIVTGIDFSPRAIRRAGNRLRKSGAQAILMVGDVSRRLRLPGPYDLALDIGCFHGVGDREAYLRTLQLNLRTGAHWLLYAFLAGTLIHAAIGVGEPDMARIEAMGLRLRSRTDGLDRPGRPSAWFLFENVGSGSDKSTGSRQ